MATTIALNELIAVPDGNISSNYEYILELVPDVYYIEIVTPVLPDTGGPPWNTAEFRISYASQNNWDVIGQHWQDPWTPTTIKLNSPFLEPIYIRVTGVNGNFTGATFKIQAYTPDIPAYYVPLSLNLNYDIKSIDQEVTYLTTPDHDLGIFSKGSILLGDVPGGQTVNLPGSNWVDPLPITGTLPPTTHIEWGEGTFLVGTLDAEGTFIFSTIKNFDPCANNNGYNVVHTYKLVVPGCPKLQDEIPAGIYSHFYDYTIYQYQSIKWNSFSLLTPLPKGLNFESIGTEGGLAIRIFGTPAVWGYYTFEVMATGYIDSACDGPQIIEIYIKEPPKIVTLTLVKDVIYNNTVYSDWVLAAYGQPPYHYYISSGNLPYGLNLDSYTGNILGTTTTIGTYFFSVTVVDANDLTDTRSYQLSVVDNPELLQDVYPSHISESIVVKDNFHQQYLYSYLPYAVKDIKDA